MQLELLAGNSSLVTTVVEHGLSFRLDLASVYVPLIPVHSIWSLVIMFVIPCYQIFCNPMSCFGGQLLEFSSRHRKATPHHQL
jgi:hypothetical protein